MTSPSKTRGYVRLRSQPFALILNPFGIGETAHFFGLPWDRKDRARFWTPDVAACVFGIPTGSRNKAKGCGLPLPWKSESIIPYTPKGFRPVDDAGTFPDFLFVCILYAVEKIDKEDDKKIRMR